MVQCCLLLVHGFLHCLFADNLFFCHLKSTDVLDHESSRNHVIDFFTLFVVVRRTICCDRLELFDSHHHRNRIHSDHQLNRTCQKKRICKNKIFVFQCVSSFLQQLLRVKGVHFFLLFLEFSLPFHELLASSLNNFLFACLELVFKECAAKGLEFFNYFVVLLH